VQKRKPKNWEKSPKNRGFFQKNYWQMPLNVVL
jgi:hypothetical protein